MPRIRGGARPIARTWQQLICDYVREGKALPLVSNRLFNDLVLGGHQETAEAFCNHLAQNPDFAACKGRDLPQCAEIASVMVEVATGASAIHRDYLDFIKNRLFDIAEAEGIPDTLSAELESQFDELSFSDLAAQLGRPRFDQGADDPLLVLASLDLPVYLTTSPYRFLEAALTQAGKQPHTAFCRWNPQLDGRPDPLGGDYEPSSSEPLVFHLHGLDSIPESLVLSEDDYLQFLVAVTQDSDRVPVRIRQALTESSLMLLGYDLGGWEFRTLFWGLINSRSTHQQSVSVLQLQPSESERKFLQKYLSEADFAVFWGDMSAYVQELLEELEGGT